MTDNILPRRNDAARVKVSWGRLARTVKGVVVAGIEKKKEKVERHGYGEDLVKKLCHPAACCLLGSAR